MNSAFLGTWKVMQLMKIARSCSIMIVVV